MMDWFASAVTSIGAAKDISQSLVTLRDAEMVRSKVFELTNSLMDLQQQLMRAQLEQMELIKRIRTLEDESQSLKQREDVMDRYELVTFPTSHHAYVLKEQFRDGEASQFLCSRCFEKGERITLQGKVVLNCPECKTTIRKERQSAHTPRVVRRY
ncbi:hypothetical protein RAL92_25925 [Metapseudomonas otitidis]|uniref:hypothetical protein n=1 Tax=Metapseudomonas otitidis TaxID=319939 RepID=UPI00321750D5